MQNFPGRRQDFLAGCATCAGSSSCPELLNKAHLQSLLSFFAPPEAMQLLGKPQMST